MTAGIFQKFAFSSVTSRTLEHRQKTDGRGQRGDTPTGEQVNVQAL